MEKKMQETPKGLRRHIAILGRRNAGKSTLLNALSGQDVSIVSPQPGTTTDPVEKTMEMPGLGPVVLLDTAGSDDVGSLGEKRVERSLAVIRRMDFAIVLTDGEKWGQTEIMLCERLEKLGIPFIVARNKMDSLPAAARQPNQLWREYARLPQSISLVDISAKSGAGLDDLRFVLANMGKNDESGERSLLEGLLAPDGLVVLVAPLDSGAPQGRLILPQVQAIRACLDAGCICVTLTEDKYRLGLEKLAVKPSLVICDSQVVKEVAQATPEEIPLTTFSILMARFKGNLLNFAKGAAALQKLAPGDCVLIQEACSHHPLADDIGRVKIPALLRKMAGGDLRIKFAQGKEFTEYEPDIKAIVHCGACVITRKQMLARQDAAKTCAVPMTNYGMAISLAKGILPRALALFPKELEAFASECGEGAAQ